MAVHVRTTLSDSATYSYIEQVVVAHGKTNLEFHKDAFYVNGQRAPEDNFPMIVDDMEIKRLDGRGRQFEIKIDYGPTVIVRATKSFMSAKLGGDISKMKDVVGMLGSYFSGDLISREGKLMTDYNEYGFEWQVHPEKDGQLFMEARLPQLPYGRCRMPTARASRRKLRASANTELHGKAVELCAEHHPQDINLCIDDVLMSGDLDIVYAW